MTGFLLYTSLCGVNIMGKYNLIGSNNVLIGIDAGVNLTTESNVIIIGDNIKDLSKGYKNAIYLTDKCIIGDTIMGNPFELCSILKALLHNTTIKNCANNSQIVLGENA